MLPRRNGAALALMRGRAAGLLAAIFVLVSAMAAKAASELTPGEGTFTLDMAGLSVTLPFPSWISNDGVPVLAQSSVHVANLRNDTSLLVLRKAGENAVLWTEAAGAVAVHRPGYTASAHFRSLAQPIGSNCLDGHWSLYWIPPLAGSDREALVGMCGHYNLAARKNRTCDGGIVTAVAVEKPEGVVSTYVEWCTVSFDVNDEQKWPVKRDDIEQRARLLQQKTGFTEIGR